MLRKPKFTFDRRPSWIRALLTPIWFGLAGGVFATFAFSNIALLLDSEAPKVVGQAWGGITGMFVYTTTTYIMVQSIIGPASKRKTHVQHNLDMVYERPGSTEVWFEQVPVSEEKVKRLAEILLVEGKKYKARYLMPERVLFSRSEYADFTDWAVEKGWLRWKNPSEHRKGVEVTKPGKAVFAQYLKLEPATPGYFRVVQKQKA